MSSNTVYYTSPFGLAVHPWLNKADTKFNADGVYKLGLVLSGEEAQAMKERVDAGSAAALERYFEEKKLTKPSDRKKWSTYVPYVVEEDDAGNPTGFIEFKFKQNAKLKLKDGTTKELSISILDASGKKNIRKPVFGGSELRVNYTMRDIVMGTSFMVGVQLAFGRVQVKKLAESTMGGGFDAVEGYTEGEDEEEGQTQQQSSSTNQSTSGDY